MLDATIAGIPASAELDTAAARTIMFSVNIGPAIAATNEFQPILANPFQNPAKANPAAVVGDDPAEWRRTVICLLPHCSMVASRLRGGCAIAATVADYPEASETAVPMTFIDYAEFIWRHEGMPDGSVASGPAMTFGYKKAALSRLRLPEPRLA